MVQIARKSLSVFGKKKTLSSDDKKVWEDFSKTIKEHNRDRESYFHSNGMLNGDVSENKILKDQNKISKEYKDRAALVLNKNIFNEKVVDKKKLRELKRGKVAPEAILDLHGMTSAQAFPIVKRFLLNAVNNKFRLILIITGKGKQSNDNGGVGILKKKLPFWLSEKTISKNILSVFHASNNHGGSGAFYVYMKKSS